MRLRRLARRLRLYVAVAPLALACRAEGPEPIPVDPGACERAGERLEQLQCQAPWGPAWLTPQGAPFAEACLAAAADGRPWHAQCLARIRDCGEIGARYSGKLCQ